MVQDSAAAVALDPELVQRAINKLQSRILALERDRDTERDKQAALVTRLMARVTALEERL